MSLYSGNTKFTLIAKDVRYDYCGHTSRDAFLFTMHAFAMSKAFQQCAYNLDGEFTLVPRYQVETNIRPFDRAVTPAQFEAHLTYAYLANIHNDWPGRHTGFGQKLLTHLQEIVELFGANSNDTANVLHRLFKQSQKKTVIHYDVVIENGKIIYEMSTYFDDDTFTTRALTHEDAVKEYPLNKYEWVKK